MNSELRPVGTEFEIHYPPGLDSTNYNPEGRTFRYRVVAHVLAELPEGGEAMLEEIRAVARIEQGEGGDES